MLICAGHVIFKDFRILMIKIPLRIKFFTEIKCVVDKRESKEIREGIS